MNYYNDYDKGAAAWLRELIKAGLIPNGYVDERSITEVTPSDLEGFTQCHFFAGIGGWSYALQLAGIPATTRLWTGSPPCQPFSVAGKQLGQLDERHLAPAFMRLVDQCRPPVLFGEQVAAAIGKHWLDDLFTELERQGYACGAAVLPAASVGAPHKRDRLFFGANLLDDTGLHVASGEIETANNVRQEANRSANQPGGCGLPYSELGNASHLSQHRSGNAGTGGRDEYSDNGSAGSMAHGNNDRQQSGGGRGCGSETSSTRDDAGRSQPFSGVADANDTRSQGWVGMPERSDQQPAGASGVAGSMADATSIRCEHASDEGHAEQHQASGEESTGISGSGILRPTNSHNGFWSDADWIGCRDGKFRPVEARAQQMVDGLSGGMGRSSDPSMRKAIEEIGFPIGKNIPARVSRLRGYGNAIVPQCAAEFIKAFAGACSDES